MTGKEYNEQFTEEELKNEIWKDIPDYEGYYQVSSLGRVKSLERIVYRNQKIKIKVRERMLNPTPLEYDNRFYVTLHKNGAKVTNVHRIVLFSFVGPCPEGMECCHNDGNPTNNKPENLRWDTPSNNQKDRIKHGTDDRGEKQKTHILTKQEVLKIREMYNKRVCSQVQMSKIYKVTKSAIWMVVHRHSWSHI